MHWHVVITRPLGRGWGLGCFLSLGFGILILRALWRHKRHSFRVSASASRHNGYVFGVWGAHPPPPTPPMMAVYLFFTCAGLLWDKYFITAPFAGGSVVTAGVCNQKVVFEFYVRFMFCHSAFMALRKPCTPCADMPHNHFHFHHMCCR